MVVLVVNILVLNVSGQKPYFRNIRIPDEMQQSAITCLYQDNNSYMWIGTGKGLYQFDGNDYIYYTQHDKSVTLQVSALFMTPDQTLWVGTKKGAIYQVSGDSLQLFNPEEGNPKASVTGFASDKSGNLWFSTYGEGVYCYDGKRIYNINTDDGLTDNYCYTVVADNSGRMWVATDGGISLCSLKKNKKSVQKITTSEGLPDNIVLSLSSDGTGIWAGMQDAGICRLDMQTLQVSIPESSEKLDYGPVNYIVNGSGWLWFATGQHGIFSIESSTGKLIGSYEITDNANVSRINCMFADKQGNFWIASGNQLFLSPGNDLLHYSSFDQSMGKNIHSVLVDRNSNIWFSNDEGLFELEKGNGKLNKIRLPVKNRTHFISLYEDKVGYIWAGTFGGGIYCIHPISRRSNHFSEVDGLSNGNILSITGKGNEMWLATLDGAYKCEIKGNPLASGLQVSFTNYGEQNFPGNNYIYAVFVDSRNRVWFGTDGKGISMLYNGRFVNFDKAQGLQSNIIYSITEDSDGDIWFSTSNAGIYRYNGKSFRNYSLADGLSEMNITGLLADRNHHILVVHNNGVDILDTRNNSFIYYSTGVGMSDLNPDLNVCALGDDNVAWIGTQNGLIRLKIPEDISRRQPSLQLKVVSVYLDKESSAGKQVFAYNQNHITFNFNALWFVAPSLVKYQIKLSGYDLDWIDTRNNQVTYSNLPPGNYTFEVRSSIKGNFAQSEIKKYSFTIRKPFWNTFWFLLVSVLSVTLLIYFIIKQREKAMQQRNAIAREKMMFQFQTLRSQVNPHFLFNSFSTLITIIDEDKQVAIEYVEKLSQFFRDILEYREKDLVPLSEELKLIDTYYYLQKKRYCDNLTLTIEVGENECSSLIPPMVLQMLVENAIKHNVVSADKPLKVRIYTDNNFITVVNNLQRKKDKEPSTGIGITNIRNRYSLLGFGEIVIDASNDRFSVQLPIIYPEK